MLQQYPYMRCISHMFSGWSWWLMGPKMAQQNESAWCALYFQTMLSSEPVLSGGAARQQCLLTHFPCISGQSLNSPFEISWRTSLQCDAAQATEGLHSAVLSQHLLLLSKRYSAWKKTSLMFRRNKNLKANVLINCTFSAALWFTDHMFKTDHMLSLCVINKYSSTLGPVV